MLEEIKKTVSGLARKIGAPEDLLPGYGKIKYDAYPYIEIDDEGFMYFVISERGKEIERKKTKDPDELLYWIYADITFLMACDFEMKHRIKDKDCRRIMFEKQEELLGVLSGEWQQRERDEHERILKNHSFDDLAGIRATYCGELRKKSYPENEINKLAYEKYPVS